MADICFEFELWQNSETDFGGLSIEVLSKPWWNLGVGTILVNTLREHRLLVMLCLAWAPRGHPAAQRRGCGGNQPSQGGHSFGHSMYVYILYVFLVPSLDGLGRSWHLTIGCCRGKGKRPPKFRIQIKSMLRTQNPEPHEQHSEQTLYLNLDMVAMTSKTYGLVSGGR